MADDCNRDPRDPCRERRIVRSSHQAGETRETGETTMAIFVIGGTGFIGIRVIPLLVARGETVVCMDINPNAPSLAGLRSKGARAPVPPHGQRLSSTDK